MTDGLENQMPLQTKHTPAIAFAGVCFVSITIAWASGRRPLHIIVFFLPDIKTATPYGIPAGSP